MNSIIFSDDEARYLRAILIQLEKPPDDDNRTSWIFSGINIPPKEAKIAGEFRILVLGDKTVGKTSLLEKVSAICSSIHIQRFD